MNGKQAKRLRKLALMVKIRGPRTTLNSDQLYKVGKKEFLKKNIYEKINLNECIKNIKRYDKPRKTIRRKQP